MGIVLTNDQIVNGLKVSPPGSGITRTFFAKKKHSRKADLEVDTRATRLASDGSSATMERPITTDSVPGITWTLEEFQKLFRNYRHEEDYEVRDIEGTLPEDLEGTFYRNGPGIMELRGHKMHCFDGHGLIAKLAIKDGRIHFRSRYVKTQVYEEEMKADKVLYRGFGTQKPGGVLANFMDFRDKPVANTSMLEWGGKLYALWEAHNPFVLDPASLETLGEETFGGGLRQEQPFTAHPSYDKDTDRLVAFSNGIRHGEGKLHIWEIDRDNRICKSISHTVGLLPVLYLHDFQVTKNWCIFHQAPLSIQPGNILQYALGLKDQTKQITFDGSMPGKWWLVPRDGGQPVIIETEPGMIWHYGNAHEDEKGNVVVDACTMDRFSFGEFDMRDPVTIPTSEVARFTIDPKGQTAERRILLAQPCDFPRLNPEYQNEPSYKFLYCAASKDTTENFPFQRVLKINVHDNTYDSWLAPPGCFVGEPIFVPKAPPATLEKEFSRVAAHKVGPNSNGSGSAEDNGWIACLVSDCRKECSSLVILDARDLAKGPVCKINLKKLLPMAFHCAWSDTAFV